MIELDTIRKHIEEITGNFEEMKEERDLLACENKNFAVYLGKLGLNLDEISNIAWGDASLRGGKLSELAYAEYTKDLPEGEL